MNFKSITFFIVLFNALFFYVSLFTSYFLAWPEFKYPVFLSPTTFFALSFGVAASFWARLSVLAAIFRALSFLVVCALAKLFTILGAGLSGLMHNSQPPFLLTAAVANGVAIAMVGASASRFFQISMHNRAFLRFFLLGIISYLVMNAIHGFQPDYYKEVGSYMELDSISFWLIAGLAVWTEIPEESGGSAKLMLELKPKKILALTLAMIPSILIYLFIFIDFLQNYNGKCHIWMDAYQEGTSVECFTIWLTNINGFFYHILVLGWILFVFFMFWPGAKTIQNPKGYRVSVLLSYTLSTVVWIITNLVMANLLVVNGVKSLTTFIAKVAVSPEVPNSLKLKTIDEMQNIIHLAKLEPGWIEKEGTHYTSKNPILTRTVVGRAPVNSEEHRRDFDRGELVIRLEDKTEMSRHSDLITISSKAGEHLTLLFERKDFNYWNGDDRRSESVLPIVGQNYYFQLTEIALPGEEGQLTKKFLEDLAIHSSPSLLPETKTVQ